MSLGNVCRWLAQQAELLGVEIFPGFAATEVLFSQSEAVIGVATGDMGLERNGEPGPNFQLGMELHAKYTVFAEDAAATFGRQLTAKYRLDEGRDPQVYGIGLKELWQIQPANHQSGLVIHTAGWPLDTQTYGGSFPYHMEDHLVCVGFVVGLGYTNPYLNPYEEFQRYKTHAAVRPFLKAGKTYLLRSKSHCSWRHPVTAETGFPGRRSGRESTQTPPSSATAARNERW